MAASLTASLVWALLFTFSVSTGQRIITAEPGDKVILPCRAAENKDVIAVEWSRTDLESDHYVLLYRDKKLNPEAQSLSFRNRVDLLDVKNGDVSLVLKNVKTDDTGTYECRVIQGGNNLLDTDPICIINLRVKPGHRIITAEPGDNVILTCRASENKDVKVVEWRRTDLESDHYVLVYRDSQFDLEDQFPSFINRVDLLDVENGDVSLVLKNVKTDDTGTYECRVFQRGNNLLDTEPISIINLIVEPGNEDGPEEDERIHFVLTVAILVELFAVISLTGFVLYRRKGHLCMKQKLPPAETELMNPEKRPPTE